MACSLARRAARLAIFVLRRLGQRSGNRAPNSKTPPQAEASAIDGQAEGEADRARGGGSTGDLISVGVRTPRTDKHLLQLPKEAYPEYGSPTTILWVGTQYSHYGKGVVTLVARPSPRSWARRPAT